MARLISVKGPHTTDPDRPIKIQWSMGNTCNFSCDYCPSILHNGSSPWLSTELYLDTVHKLCKYYSKTNRPIHFELIGGEVTTIPGFEKILRVIAEYNARTTIYTNGSRTVEWWNEAKEYLQGVVITYHPHTMEEEHLFNVVSTLKGHCTLDINIAGIGGEVIELGSVADRLRKLFEDNSIQSIYDVSICVKTMYKKYLGTTNNENQQEPYYAYTQEELEILQRPGVLPRPPKPKPNNPVEKDPEDEMQHPRFWATEFLYEDGSTKYVQSHQIINEGLNSFKGMRCELGYDGINIDMNGEIISSWCGAKSFGNITQLDTWDLPKSETVCPYDFCNNLNDISVTKTL